MTVAPTSSSTEHTPPKYIYLQSTHLPYIHLHSTHLPSTHTFPVHTHPQHTHLLKVCHKYVCTGEVCVYWGGVCTGLILFKIKVFLLSSLFGLKIEVNIHTCPQKVCSGIICLCFTSAWGGVFMWVCYNNNINTAVQGKCFKLATASLK